MIPVQVLAAEVKPTPPTFARDDLARLAAEQMSAAPIELGAALLLLQSSEVDQQRVDLCISTLRKILTNMVRHRSSAKHRRLKLGNKALQSRVFELPGGVEVLLASGFVLEHQQQENAASAESWHLVFPCGREEDGNALSDETCVRLNSIVEVLM